MLLPLPTSRNRQRYRTGVAQNAADELFPLCLGCCRVPSFNPLCDELTIWNGPLMVSLSSRPPQLPAVQRTRHHRPKKLRQGGPPYCFILADSFQFFFAYAFAFFLNSAFIKTSFVVLFFAFFFQEGSLSSNKVQCECIATCTAIFFGLLLECRLLSDGMGQHPCGCCAGPLFRT